MVLEGEEGYNNFFIVSWNLLTRFINNASTSISTSENCSTSENDDLWLASAPTSINNNILRDRDTNTSSITWYITLFPRCFSKDETTWEGI